MYALAEQSQETEMLLQNLNPSQRQAVLKTEGRYLVLAGAGAGKTKVLTTRIAYLLEQGIDPYRIMAITFTNKSAKEMRQRAIGLNRAASYSWIGTFHSVCSRILTKHLHILDMETYSLMDRDDQVTIVKQASKGVDIELDKGIISSVLSQISLWKSNDITPGQAESEYRNHRERVKYAYIYQKYEDIKVQNNYFDYDDLLLKTIRLFQASPETLGKYQSMFKYVMIDEFQDTNKIQFDLVEMLTQQHKNLFLCGDPDQSIYSFRSAQIENILNYQRIHPETEVIRLEENYRSTQNIVNASNALIKHNDMRLERESFSVSEVGDDVHVFRFNDASREADFVARMIVNVRKATGCSWSDCAVLYRMNFQSKHLELALRDENVPYKIVGTTSFYDRKEIKDLVSYLRVIMNRNDECAIERSINVPSRKIGATTIDKLRAFADDRKINLFTALQNIDEAAAEYKINKPTVAGIKEYVAIITDMFKEGLKPGFTATGFLKEVILRSNFMSQFNRDKEEDEARIENVAHLRDFARHWDSQGQEVNNMAQFVSEISLDGEDDIDEFDYVTLTSIHSAKGLEWDETFIIGLEDDVFPHHRSKHTAADLEEERRLFYVAMTRAAERLYISYSAYKYDYGSQKPVPQHPSPFLGEIPELYKTNIIQTG